MSAYRVHESAIRSPQALVEALGDCAKRVAIEKGATEAEAQEAAAEVRNAVELHLDEPVQLYGYHGDLREEAAHVVVRQDIVNRRLGSGGSSNDLGFIRQEDGTYHAVVSEYDQKAWWNHQADRYWQLAQVVEAEHAAISQGYYVTRTEEQGGIKLTCQSR